MSPRMLISLLTCCSLVLGTVLPPRSFSRSSQPAVASASFPTRLASVTVEQAGAAAASRTVVVGTYSVRHLDQDVLRLQCVPIDYGETVFGSIDAAGEEDCFDFAGQVGDEVYASLDTPVGTEFQLTLTGPGTATQSCYSYDSCQIDNVTLSAGGNHTLSVTASGAYTGTYSLYLARLNAPPAPIAYGETVTGTIAVAGEEDAYSFDGEAGDTVYAQLESPIGAEFYLNLSMPGGGFHACYSYDTCLIEDVTLPSTGVYTLTVGGSGTYTGDYSLTLGSPQAVSIALGEWRTVVVTPAVPALFQIDVPPGTDNLFITLQKHSTWTSRIELTRAGGVLKSAEQWSDQILQLPLPAEGRYDLQVSGSGVARLAVLASLPELPLGEWVTGTIYSEYGHAWYQCDVPAGQDALYVYAEALGLISQLQVSRGAIDTPPYWSMYGVTMALEIPAPDPGTYYVQLSDSALVIGDSQERDHMIRADVAPIEPPACAQPVISSMTPAKGGTTMPVTVSIAGQCLDKVSKACLARSGDSDVCAGTLAGSDDGRALRATFDLSGAGPGDWSLVVTAPGGDSATAAGSFFVQAGGEPDLWVDINGREQFRIGRTQTYHVRYGNAGAVDAHDVLLNVRVPAAFQVAVDLPHPPDASIDWESIPSVVTVGSDKVIPVWLLRVGAGSQDGFDLSITIPAAQIGAQATITAEMEQVASRFAQTGILNDVPDSPMFALLADSIAQVAEEQTGVSWGGRALFGSRSPQVPRQDIDGDLMEGLKAFWDYLVPKYAIVGAGIGLLLGLCFGGPLGWIAVGLTIGSLVDSVLGGFSLFKDVFIPTMQKLVDFFGLEMIDSISPEDKFGPSGYDPAGTPAAQLERWIPADHPLDYRIDFWNKEDAPAATVDVIISDTLDANLDWDTFYFREIGFLDWRVELEPAQYFNVDVADVAIDLSRYYPGEPVVDLVVNVEGTFDPATGLAEWHFHTLDPATRQPPDNPYAGFLPPMTDSGWELGWVVFSVAQKNGLSSGAVIQNQAFVKFDLNPFNPAPKAGPFANTVDSAPPASSAHIPSRTLRCNQVFVTWTGQDDATGSGWHSVDLYVDDLNDGAAATLWRGTLQGTGVVYSGVPGGRYGFYTRARDNVGNLESAPAPLVYDALATVDSYCQFLPVTPRVR